MKITTNPIGNYGPRSIRGIQQNNNIQKTKNSENLQEKSKASNAGITNEEKKFFASKYPLNKNEIMDYHYYQKSGKMAGVKVGSLIDRRG